MVKGARFKNFTDCFTFEIASKPSITEVFSVEYFGQNRSKWAFFPTFRIPVESTSKKNITEIIHNSTKS